MNAIVQNAGLQLWKVQQSQRTGLCIGIDPDWEEGKPWNKELYRTMGQSRAARETYVPMFESLLSILNHYGVVGSSTDTVNFLAGITQYCVSVVDAALNAGVYVLKPQSGYFEKTFLGQIVLSVVCQHIQKRAAELGVTVFVILDRKGGDIDKSQAPLYAGYLSERVKEVIPGLGGAFGFDAMTVTTWMGVDVLQPGLSYLQDGKGLIVVTRTSNPTGTTLQDALVLPATVELTESQEQYRFSKGLEVELQQTLGRKRVTAYEMMLYLTSQFSDDHGLDTDGVSPIFTVIGSTMPASDSFRRIRGDGAVALIPGFGRQKGSLQNVLALLVKEGPLAGHLGVLASSGAMMFAWAKQYGGSDDPDDLTDALSQAITRFRADEMAFYKTTHIEYPF